MEAVIEAVDLKQMGKEAKAAAAMLAKKTTAEKNAVIRAIAAALEANTPAILEANRRDLDLAAQQGMDPIWIRDRIALEPRMPGIIADVRKVAESARSGRRGAA